jgi:methyl-accepting chemotaxis protein
MLPKFKLRDRILLGYSFPVLILVVISSLAFLNSRRLDTAYKEIENARRASEYTQDALQGFVSGERTVDTLLILDDEARAQRNKDIVDAKNSYNLGISNSKKYLASAEKMVEVSQQKEQLTRMRDIAREVEQFNREILSLIEAGKRNEAVKKFETYGSRNLILEFEKTQKDFENQQDNIIQSLIEEVRQATALLQVIAGLGTLLAVAITISISYMLSSGIVRAIQGASTAVASLIKDITDTVNAQERIISEQSASVNETTNTIQELGMAALKSAEQAEISAEKAKQALTLAEGGTRTVGLTVEGISELRDQVTAIATQIVRLSEQTSQISTVSDLVADLANQTNMLALNAGVEAARAGDQGKGFAVVASEIRKLADQSRKSADKIHILANEVQAAINSTIMVTDEGTKKATQGITLVAETGDVFTNITDAVNNVFLNTQQITQTAKQQAVAVQRVVAAVNAINLGAKETNEGITQVKEATQDLNEAAQNLEAVL